MSKLSNLSYLSIILIMGLFSAQLYGQSTIKLGPKQSKSLTNHLVWTVKATCNIKCKQKRGRILVSIVKNKSKVNGRELSKGQTASFNVKHNDRISVSADPGTKVRLINVGTSPILAVCST